VFCQLNRRNVRDQVGYVAGRIHFSLHHFIYQVPSIANFCFPLQSQIFIKVERGETPDYSFSDSAQKLYFQMARRGGFHIHPYDARYARSHFSDPGPSYDGEPVPIGGFQAFNFDNFAWDPRLPMDDDNYFYLNGLEFDVEEWDDGYGDGDPMWDSRSMFETRRRVGLWDDGWDEGYPSWLDMRDHDRVHRLVDEWDDGWNDDDPVWEARRRPRRGVRRFPEFY